MLRVLLLAGCLLALPTWAMDAKLKSEIERLRETYWETLTGPHWVPWDHRTSNGNDKALKPVEPTMQMLRRMFGAQDPAADELLRNLRSRPKTRRPGTLELLDQQEILKEGFAKLDQFLSAAEARQTTDWRTTPFGREVSRLSERLLKAFHHLDKSTSYLRERLAEWQAEAQTLARLAPYPDFGEFLDTMGFFVGDYIRSGTNADYYVRMKVALDLMRTLLNELDAGWTDCERKLDDNLKLTIKRPAPGKPTQKLLAAPRT